MTGRQTTAGCTCWTAPITDTDEAVAACPVHRKAGRESTPRTTPEPRFNEERLAEMTPTTAAAAKRAAWQEWEWSNPWCDDCDEHHLPDEHAPAYYEGDDDV